MQSNPAGKLPRQVQLTPSEQLLVQTRPVVWGYIRLVLLALLFSAAAVISLIFLRQYLLYVVLPLAVLALIVWLYFAFRYRTRFHLVVTSKRVVFFRKSLGVRLDDIHLEEVNDVEVDQGLIGRMFNYGTVTIVRSKFTVLTRDPFIGIRSPFDVSGAIERAVESAKKE